MRVLLRSLFAYRVSTDRHLGLLVPLAPANLMIYEACSQTHRVAVITP